MFSRLSRIFARLVGIPDAPAFLAPDVARVYNPTELFERDMRRGLDAGKVTGDDVLDAINYHKGRLHLVDPMIKARMMGVLSDELRTIAATPSSDRNEETVRKYEQMIEGGQTLAVETLVPEEIAQSFYKVFDEFARDIGKMGTKDRQKMKQLLDPSTPLEGDKVLEAIHFMTEGLTRRLGIKNGVETTVIKDPKLGRLGQQSWDCIHQRPKIEVNFKDFERVRDMPLLGVVVGHEVAHAAVENAMEMISDMRSKGIDIEDIRKKQPDLYMLVRICDRMFHSVEESVYRRHPEEILAHRIGVRFGVCLNKALAAKRTRADFASLATAFIHPAIKDELDAAFPGAPAIERRDAVPWRLSTS